MHFPDHGVAGHTTKLFGDLAGRLAFAPHLLQQLYAFIGPGHRALHQKERPFALAARNL
jgi:Sec-independent protein secretion pathway component TatC